MEQATSYGLRTTVELPFELALERARKALANEGFSILSEIDVATILKQKLDVVFRPYVILGACSAPLAHQALCAERDIGLLLPCNVIVYADDPPGKSVVAVIDPVAALAVTGNDDIRPVAEDARVRLERVLKKISE